MLNKKIYYADKWLLDQLDDKFELVDKASWVTMYRDKENGSLWRLGERDKFQTQCFVRIEDSVDWKVFDAMAL